MQKSLLNRTEGTESRGGGRSTVNVDDYPQLFGNIVGPTRTNPSQKSYIVHHW